VIEQMSPAIRARGHRDDIHRILSAEEERFGQTLARGLRLFEEVAQRGGDISARKRSACTTPTASRSS
jgi:alanyl-tRNA synthetase